MKSITVFLTVDTTPSIGPSITLNSNIHTVAVNTSHFTNFSATELLGKHPDQFKAILSREINKPLGNLGLAVEMLEKAALNEMDMLMGIISRNALRINNLLSDFKPHQYSNEIL